VVDVHAVELTLNVDISLVRHNIGVEDHRAFSSTIELETIYGFQRQVNETCNMYKVVAQMLRKLVIIVLRSLQDKAQSLFIVLLDDILIKRQRTFLLLEPPIEAVIPEAVSRFLK